MDVKTAGRTLDLFEAFESLRRPASLSELAAIIGMPVSSCFALVRTIERRGFLYSIRPRGPIYPTGRLLKAALTIRENDPIAQRVAAHLTALRDRSGETVVLGVLLGEDVLYVDVFEAPHVIRYSPKPGERRPAHANSIAKAILGEMAPEGRRSVLKKLRYEKLTAKTLLAPEELEAEVLRGSRRGWYANIGESAPDLTAVAGPLLINGDLFGVSIAGPTSRIRPKMKQLVDMLQRTLAKLSDVRARKAVG